MDGVGIGAGDPGDAVRLARTPTLTWLRDNAQLYTQLKAHGTAVGMPSDADMGNSEVGHNALGAGRVFDQGAKRVAEAIASSQVFASDAWQRAMQRALQGGTLHFIGLLSDGNVHAHINHLLAMLQRAHHEGASRVRVHTLLDGRDVGAHTALAYIEPLETLLGQISAHPGRDYKVASGGGRMHITMDRYNADWPMVERGWRTHVQGIGRRFPDATTAINTLRAEDPSTNDQFMPAFVIADSTGQPVGPITDGDAVILFNFRGDRAIELTRAFEEEPFSAFDRGPRPDVFFAGMMQYDGDLKLPTHFLVTPPAIDRTMGEHLARIGLPQLAVSETQKYGHVTYFWNGNRSGYFNRDVETYIEIPSDNVLFSERPWMKAAEITDAAIQALRAQPYRFARVNYPNGDMVGHTGDLQATIMSVEAVDLCLRRLLDAVTTLRGVAIVTADHGNADQMYYLDKSGHPLRDPAGQPVPMTSHSLNPVPFWIYDPTRPAAYTLNTQITSPGLANVAATALNLMGLEAPADYAPSLIRPR
jgi:2,3-bisphosphoglycerate-independent phosphoglycerate mutase